MGKIVMLAAVLAVSTAQVSVAAPVQSATQPSSMMSDRSDDACYRDQGGNYKGQDFRIGRHGLPPRNACRIAVELAALSALIWGFIALASHHHGPGEGPRPTSP